jgi:hypothetical protein
MYKNIVLGAIIASSSLFPISKGNSQSHCQSYWTAAYKCSQGCGSCGGGHSSPPQYTPPDPRQVALQDATRRYHALVQSLSDKYSLLDRQSWTNLPLGTEATSFNTANQLHKLLVNKVDAINFRVRELREELAELSAVNAGYPGTLTKLRADIATLRRERDRLTNALDAEKRQLDLTQRVSKQLEARAQRYEQDIDKNKTAVLSWVAVLLPPGVAGNVTPKPYESAVAWAPSVPERPAVRQQERQKQIEVAQVQAAKYGYMRLEINPSPLSGTPLDAVAQLESVANAYGVANRANDWDLNSKVNTLRPVVAQLRQNLSNETTEHKKLEGEVAAVETLLSSAKQIHLRATDNLQAAKASFLYRAADSWIWENAKTEAINQLKDETRRLVAAKWFGVAYRDMSDHEMKALFDAGKRNIFGLGDKVLSSGDALYEVTNRIRTLQTQGQGYIKEAARLASQGSPGEMLEFVDGMYKGLADDSEKLVKANLDAVSIPEPFKSISAKYFVKKASE